MKGRVLAALADGTVAIFHRDTGELGKNKCIRFLEQLFKRSLFIVRLLTNSSAGLQS